MARFRVLHAEQVGDVYNITFRDLRNGEEYVTSAASLRPTVMRQAIKGFLAHREAPDFIPHPGSRVEIGEELSVGEV